MKTIKTIIAILALAISSASCSKDDDATPLAPEQNPLAGYLSATGFNQYLSTFNSPNDYEFGYSFIPLVNGKMTAIVVRIPDAHLGLRVTVWDKAAGTVLRTESIDVATAGVEVTKTITALDLIKDKEYFLTFNSNDWYSYRRNDDASVTYPFTVGDIKITSYSYGVGTNQAIPNLPQIYYYAGDCSFKFQK